MRACRTRNPSPLSVPCPIVYLESEKNACVVLPIFGDSEYAGIVKMDVNIRVKQSWLPACPWP